nr:hypothetical protein [uncultured Flavobacterium sp.]
MKSKSSFPDITFTVQRGGHVAYEKTGIYPDFLRLHSAKHKRSWRFKQTKDTQNGVLKVNGQVAFYYSFDGFGCKMQSVIDGVVTDEWKLKRF